MSARKTSLSQLAEDERGSALVEGALVLPVVIALLGGIYEFGYYFYEQQLVTTGVRDAARYLARYNYTDSSGTSPCAVLTTASCPSITAAVGYAKCIATNTTTSCASTDSTRVIGWTTSSRFSVTFTPNNNPVTGPSPCGSSYGCNSQFSSAVYSVTVQATFAGTDFGLLAPVGLGLPSITVSHTERVVGVG